jgi:Phage tail assembly chaperone protein, TAC
MEFAFGVLHYPPDAFWRMTIREYERAIAGHNRFHSGEHEPDVDVPHMQRFIAEMKLLHPDNPPPS